MNQLNYIWMQVAENNSAGNPIGRATHIEFGEGLHFEANSFHGYPFRTSYKKKLIHFNGMSFHYEDTHEWYGNIMWNAYLINTEAACNVINALYASSKWGLTEAYTELGDALKIGALTQRQLGQFLSDEIIYKEQA